MKYSTDPAKNKDYDLLASCFVKDDARKVWVYNHDDRVFKVIAACAKLNISCRNVPKDDPNSIEIDNEQWIELFDDVNSEESVNISEITDNKYENITPKHLDDEQNPAVRTYNFNNDDDINTSTATDILDAAEAEMTTEYEDDDMENAVNALAEQTQATNTEAKYDFENTAQEEPEHEMIPAPQEIKHETIERVRDNTSHKPDDLYDWEDSLQKREEAISAREKALRTRQQALNDLENNLMNAQQKSDAEIKKLQQHITDQENKIRSLLDKIEKITSDFRGSLA